MAGDIFQDSTTEQAIENLFPLTTACDLSDIHCVMFFVIYHLEEEQVGRFLLMH